MLIQKQLTGEVWLIENGSIVASILNDCTINCSYKRAGLEVIDESGRRFIIELGRVDSTQVLPAAAVPFTGDLDSLYTLLVTSFLNEFHTQAGAVVTSDDVTNLSVVPGANVTQALNNLAAGGGLETNITGQSGNYSILLTDYIIYATANASFRLPTIGANIGQVYRIYANNYNVNVLCDDPSGDRITGQISVSLKKWDSATFRAIYSNQWLIGD